MFLLFRFFRTGIGLALLRFAWRRRRHILSFLRRFRRPARALPGRLIRR
jgi:hypothetical protein